MSGILLIATGLSLGFDFFHWLFTQEAPRFAPWVTLGLLASIGGALMLENVGVLPQEYTVKDVMEQLENYDQRRLQAPSSIDE